MGEKEITLTSWSSQREMAIEIGGSRKSELELEVKVTCPSHLLGWKARHIVACRMTACLESSQHETNPQGFPATASARAWPSPGDYKLVELHTCFYCLMLTRACQDKRVL